ncbi:MAG: methionyl-tRNA formyltransferase [Candidatus Dadabacteria bacterium]|nr:MAG: methionyl-tRNA formyltransferase [Candidatus Dadabacteria bacterium]
MNKTPFKVIYFGTPEFAIKPLEALLELSDVEVSAVVTKVDKPAKRGQRLTPPPVKVYAMERGIPVFQYESLKKEVKKFFLDIKPFGIISAGIVCAYGLIIPKEVLEFSPVGLINIHPSLLPRWRGAAPIERALLAGDKETGVSLMKLTEGLDQGPIYSSARCEILPNDTAGTLRERLSCLGASLLKENLKLILTGKLLPKPQSEEGVTYAEKIAKEEGLIDFAKESAEEIERKVRAFNPIPSAFTYLDGKRLKVLRAEVGTLGKSAKGYKPSQVIVAERGRFEVACKGASSILLKEVQLEGKRAMVVEEFLNGYKIKEGAFLGRYG